MTIGELIKTWRKEKGLTQKQLAEKTGIATITIQQYEGGKRVPKAEFLARIAQALGVSEYDFWEASLSAENDGFYDKVRLLYGNITVENIFKYVQNSKNARMNNENAQPNNIQKIIGDLKKMEYLTETEFLELNTFLDYLLFKRTDKPE